MSDDSLERIPDHLAGWGLYERFTLKQAACLWVGVDPNAAQLGTAYRAAEDRIRSAIENKQLVAEVDWEFQDELEVDGSPKRLSRVNEDGTTIRRADLAAWEKSQPGRSKFPFGAMARPAPGIYGYRTKQLDLLWAAVEAHMLPAVRANKRPPKKEVVTAWLVERGASPTVAAYIDTIIRPDAAKGAGRPRKNLQNDT